MITHAEMLRNNSRSALPSPPIAEEKNDVSFFHKSSRFMTCLIPDFLIHRIGGMSGPQIQAWLEKVTLCMLIAMNCTLLGMLTYGINKFVCTCNSSHMVYGRLKPNTFKGNPTCIANGGIYYGDVDYGYENKSHLFKKDSLACKRAFGKQLTKGKLDVNNFLRINDMYYSYDDISRLKFLIIDRKVYDPTYCTESCFQEMIDKYRGSTANVKGMDKECLECFKDTFYTGKVACKSNGCVFADIMLWCSTVIIFSLILIKFFLAIFYAWYSKKRPVSIRNNTPVILQVTCYSEGEQGLRSTLDSLTMLEYNEDYKVIVVISDGEIKGQGETESTPEILKRICFVDDSQPMPYISLTTGHKRFNRATVHAGYYEKDGKRSKILLINKCGNLNETAKKEIGESATRR